MTTVDNVLERLGNAFQLLAMRVGNVWHDVTAPEYQLYWLFLVGFVAVGTLVYLLTPPDGVRRSLGGWLGYLFPRGVYLHPSARVDYLLFLVNRLVALETLLIPGLVASVEVAVMRWMEGHFGAPAPLWDVGSVGSLLAFTFVSALVFDFAAYANHALHHFVPVLWEIHKVHHTAEVLTPITLYRNHPLYAVAVILMRAVIVAPFLGVAAFQLLTGSILDRAGPVGGGYPLSGFRSAFSLCLAAALVCLVMTLFVRSKRRVLTG